MADIRTSFYYDPIRQGYDTNSWRTVSGAPTVVNGRLSIDNQAGLSGSTVHYVDFLKGDISFNVNVPESPTGGADRSFGVAALNSGAYIRFTLGSTLTCDTSDGITTTSSGDILWDSSWTGANVVFAIRWEAGGAKFFVNGTRVYGVSDDSVPHGPLSLYLFDSADSSMTIGDITVRGTQSYVLNPKTSDTTPTNPTGNISLHDDVTVTESVSMLLP